MEKLEKMRAQLIPKFLRRTPGEKVFQVTTSHERHRQDFVGRVLAKNPWNLDESKRRQTVGKELDIVSFTEVVGFRNDLLFNLVNGRFWYMTRRLRRLREGAKQ